MAVQNNDQTCRKYTFEIKLQVGESDGLSELGSGDSELGCDGTTGTDGPSELGSGDSEFG